MVRPFILSRDPGVLAVGVHLGVQLAVPDLLEVAGLAALRTLDFPAPRKVRNIRNSRHKIEFA